MLDRSTILALIAAVVPLFAACSAGPGQAKDGDEGGASPSDATTGSSQSPSGGNGNNSTGAGAGIPTPESRPTDYSQALRTASLKLVSALPTLEQIKRVASATDKKAAYEKELDAMFADYRFQESMIRFWKDVMRLGGGGGNNTPSRDTAPTFAARIVAEEQPFKNLFTADQNTCPTYDYGQHKFNDGNCNNNVPKHAGVLTNPGAMYQFYSNMAFRRVRWVNEVFDCRQGPYETTDKPVKMGAGEYIAPWPFTSISNAPVTFQDTKSVLCANCHTTMNHMAPLFGNFDDRGRYQNQISVMTPLVPAVRTERSHWLPAGEGTAWRNGAVTPDLPALGEAMAKDPSVLECAVARMWNFAMSKDDIVTDAAVVPTEVIKPYFDAFQADSNLKKALRAIFASADFARF